MKTWITYCIAVFTLVAFGTFVKFGKPQLKPQVAFACNGAAANEFSCYQGYYKQMVQKRGVSDAFTDLKSRYNGSTFIQNQCHQLTHVIGRAAGDTAKSVTEAYEKGDNFCLSGYFHGVMESFVGKVGEAGLKTEADTICADLRNGSKKYSAMHHNCTHGMGHGFMALEGDELFTSLKLCDYLHDSWEQQSCYTGVFMENIMADINGFHSTKYLKAAEPLYPCNAVEQQYQSACYINQTSYALRVVGQDFTKVFQLCSMVDDANRSVCYQSLGRDASGNSNAEGVQAKNYCMLGQTLEAQSNCAIGAVKDIIWHFESLSQGKDFCNSFDASVRDICLPEAENYFKTFGV